MKTDLKKSKKNFFLNLIWWMMQFLGKLWKMWENRDIKLEKEEGTN